MLSPPGGFKFTVQVTDEALQVATRQLSLVVNVGPVLTSVTPPNTLLVAKELHPGKRNNLNALCDRYQVNNSKRTLHGALLDAELLGEVYLAMTRGQESLIMDLETPRAKEEIEKAVVAEIVIQYATDAELAAHERVLANIAKERKGTALWQTLNNA